MTEDGTLSGPDGQAQTGVRDLLDQKREREKKDQKKVSREGKKRLRVNLGALQKALDIAEAAEVRAEVALMQHASTISLPPPWPPTLTTAFPTCTSARSAPTSRERVRTRRRKPRRSERSVW